MLQKPNGKKRKLNEKYYILIKKMIGKSCIFKLVLLFLILFNLTCKIKKRLTIKILCNANN